MRKWLLHAYGSDDLGLEDIDIRDVPIPCFPSRYRFRYLGSGYRPIPSTDPIPGYVSGYTALCTISPV